MKKTCWYQDIITDDELLSDFFPYKELFEGVLWEVEGKVVQGAVDVGIGANPSAEDDEFVHDQAKTVIDIVDTFRLQGQPAFDKKQFVTHVKKRYIKFITPKLNDEKQQVFTKETLSQLPNFSSSNSETSNCNFFVGESIRKKILAWF